MIRKIRNRFSEKTGNASLVDHSRSARLHATTFRCTLPVARGVCVAQAEIIPVEPAWIMPAKGGEIERYRGAVPGAPAGGAARPKRCAACGVERIRPAARER